MKRTAAKPARRLPTPEVWVRRPRCPACGGIDLLTVRSVDQGDGSTLRYAACRTIGCGQRFKLIVE